MSGKPYVFATRRARKDARALGLGEEIVEAVTAAIRAGSVARDHQAGPDALLVAGNGWVARCDRRAFGYCPGRYWSIRSVEAHAAGAIRPRPKMPRKRSGRRTRARDAAGAAFAVSLEERIEDLLRRSGPWT